MTRARENADGARLDAPLLSPALVTPNLGTPSAGVMTNVTGMPLAGLSATGTASATTYLRGDNSWQTAGGATSGMISNVWRFADSSSGTLNIASTTETVGTDARAFAATDTRHYLITGMQHISPYRNAGDNTERYQYCGLNWGLADKAINDTSSLGTKLFESLIGRALAGNSTVNAAGYHVFSYSAWFTASSTATHYTYTVYKSQSSSHQCRAYNGADYPHYTVIYEVMP